MALEPITRAEQIMSGQSLTPITREEMFLAKAGGQNVTTPTPITRREMFLSKISGSSGGGGGGSGGDTPSGNFKKKFMSFTRVKKTSATNKYDFAATFDSAIRNGTPGATCSDEEILPTKTYDGIKISDLNEYKIHFYFIEDENDLFIYGDLSGSGTNEWVSMSTMLGVEFGGVLTDIDIDQMSPDVPYVLFYYVEAEGE
jgi:hypothetical protein